MLMNPDPTLELELKIHSKPLKDISQSDIIIFLSKYKTEEILTTPSTNINNNNRK